MSMNIAVIPARGGSKRIPHKNIKEFCGKPMIAWSIEAALESECFDSVLVSTDDKEIAKIAETAGAEVPFVRPPELSDDYTGTTSVIKHAIEWMEDNSIDPDFVCCIYATAPFILSRMLQEGQKLIEQGDYNYVFSVTNYPFPIQRAIKITSNKTIEMFQEKYFNSRSQDLEDAYHDAGQFYWGKREAWLSEKLIFSSSSAPVILPRYLVQDIDTPEDWIQAELMFKNHKVSTRI